MKRTPVNLLAVLVLMLAVGACTRSGPTRTAEAFTTHLAAGEVSQAVPYVSAGIRGMMGDQKLTMALTEATRQQGTGKLESFKMVSEEVEGERAKGIYSITYEGRDEPKQETYEFVLEDREWKIYFDPSGSGK